MCSMYILTSCIRANVVNRISSEQKLSENMIYLILMRIALEPDVIVATSNLSCRCINDN